MALFKTQFCDNDGKKYIKNLTFIVWHKMKDYNGTRMLNKASL